MLNSVFGSGASELDDEHAASNKAAAINTILPAVRIPSSMIRPLSQVQHCRKPERCPSGNYYYCGFL